MSKPANLFILSLLFFVSASCATPGLDEPQVTFCIILGGEAECTEPGTGDKVKVSLEDLVGFISISPKDFATLDNHHTALHHELNECKGGRK